MRSNSLDRQRLVAGIIASVLLWLPAGLALAQDAGPSEEWRLRRSEDGIRIYVRDVEGSAFHAYRGEMTIDARLQTLAAVLDDVERSDEWLHYTEEGVLVERIDRETAVVSLLTDLPWPASDRDSVTLNRLSQDPETLTVRYSFESRPDALPEREDYIRIQDIRGYWELAPREDGNVDIVFATSSDPGGTVPAWLINLVITEQPFNSLQNLREIVEDPRYRNATMPGIREP
jgi:hypothetical protein